MAPRVLSIQSHVVHGYVGNKSAVFPLQLLGMEVDAINTVQFSNHTGYPSFKGDRTGPDQLRSLIDGLEENYLLKGYTHLLTGYMGSAAILDAVVEVATRLKKANPNLIYVCDPVLGDNGKLYVPQELVALYKTKIIPLADIVTPNQFELEQLTEGGVVTSLADAQSRMKQLHVMGASTVIVSSLDPSVAPDGAMQVLGSFESNTTSMPSYQFSLDFARVDGHYTGTGDLFAALFLAWSHEHPSQPHIATEKSIASIQCVINRTASCAKNSTVDGDASTNTDNNECRVKCGVVKRAELRLIESKRDIENPNTDNYKSVISS